MTTCQTVGSEKSTTFTHAYTPTSRRAGEAKRTADECDKIPKSDKIFDRWSGDGADVCRRLCSVIVPNGEMVND